MIPTLSQVCSLNSPLQADVEDYAAGQCGSLEIWLTKLENYLSDHSETDFRQMLNRHEMVAPVASFSGGLLVSQGPQRQEAWSQFRGRLDLCRRLEISTMVVVGDIHGPLSQEDLDRTGVSLQQLAEEAGQRDLRVALEFQARASFANNLQTAAALVAEVGSPHLGLCLDLFHFHTGPSKLSDLRYLGKHNLFHVQLCDLADVARELATDADRILPGDGELPLAEIVAHLQSIAYAGPVSLELMNPTIWQVPPRQFGEIGMTALRKILGQARM